MTVSSTTNRKTFAGDDVTTSFGTSPVVFFDTSDIALYVVDDITGLSETLVENADYTLTGGDGSTGTIDLSGGSSPWGALQTDTTLVIVRTLPLTQEVDLVNNDINDAEVQERALDKLTMLAQQDASEVARALRQPVSDPVDIADLPSAVDRAGMYLAFDADSDPVASAGTGNDTALRTDLAASTGSSLVGFKRSETGFVAQTVQTKLRQIIFPEDFGAVGDGTTDDLTPLTNFINALLAGTNLEGRMLAKTYAISGALPSITVSGTKLIGFGVSANHDVGSTTGASTIIKAITNSGFTMLTIAPTEGASAQYLTGVVLDGITFDGNSLAAKGVVIKSLRRGEINIGVVETTTTGLELNVATTLGENTSLQYNRICYVARHYLNAAVGLRLIGTASGNPSFNYFERIDVCHKDAIGIISENADNNLWGQVRVFQAAGGSATNSIEWRGGATSAQSSRDEQYLNLSTTVAAIAKGTGTYTVGAQNIQIETLDKSNSSPDPTVEAGATCYWENSDTPHYDGEWVQTTPTPTSQGGAFTTVSAKVRYKRVANGVHLNVTVTVTTANTATGYVRVPLPFTHANNGVASVLNGRVNTTSVGCSGNIAVNTAYVDIIDVTGTTVIADGNTITVSGFMEI